MNDLFYMQHAISLARRGIYTVRDNPRVGCVIVKNNNIVGEGWHAFAGQAHAESIALQEAGEDARDATCYVTLEPCVHQGKTPPCVHDIIKAKIKRVVIATLDPNPKVHHRGVKVLQDAGIEVSVGEGEQKAYALNKGFFKRMIYDKPYVRVKLAMSLDGRIALANGKSQWITSDEARKDVQYWRAQSCAILTSSKTVLDDDPQLNVRDPEVLSDIKTICGRNLVQPRRFVIDTKLCTLPSQKIYQGDAPAQIIIGNTTTISEAWKQKDIKITSLAVENAHVNLQSLMEWLGQESINEVWVEAGSSLAGALSQAKLVDEYIIYVAPKFLGPQAQPLLQLPEMTELTQAIDLEFVEYKQIGNDLRFTARLPCSPVLFKP